MANEYLGCALKYLRLGRQQPIQLTLIAGTFVAIFSPYGFAKGPGTSAGLTLTAPAGARVAALAGAGTALTDDVTAAAYNPAALGTLKRTQASFLFERGIADDAFGRAAFGSPFANHSLGLNVGYYDAGSIDIVFLGLKEKLDAQKDWTLGLGYAYRMNHLSLGVSAKYLSSKIIEEIKADAWSADVGVLAALTSRWHFGIAAQNFGTELKYEKVGHKLPRTVKAGTAIRLFEGSVPTTLLLEAPYLLNEKELNSAVGLEVGFGPLSLRGGYKTGQDLEGLTLGTGFRIGAISLDYAFGFVDELEARHLISTNFRFGQTVSEEPVIRKSAVQELKQASDAPASGRPYRTEEPKQVIKAPSVTVEEDEPTMNSAPKKASGSKHRLGTIKGR